MDYCLSFCCLLVEGDACWCVIWDGCNNDQCWTINIAVSLTCISPWRPWVISQMMVPDGTKSHFVWFVVLWWLKRGNIYTPQIKNKYSLSKSSTVVGEMYSFLGTRLVWDWDSKQFSGVKFPNWENISVYDGKVPLSRKLWPRRRRRNPPSKLQWSKRGPLGLFGSPSHNLFGFHLVITWYILAWT